MVSYNKIQFNRENKGTRAHIGDKMGAFSQKELEYLREQGLAGARGYIATVSRKQNPQLTPVGYVARADSTRHSHPSTFKA